MPHNSKGIIPPKQKGEKRTKKGRGRTTIARGKICHAVAKSHQERLFQSFDSLRHDMKTNKNDFFTQR